MLLQLFKSLHIVGFVAWFAGLFYLVRMFVYHVEALGKTEPEKGVLSQQFNLMEWRVYRIICNPAMAITWLFGAGMLFIHGYGWLVASWWMQIKLGLLGLLTVYHFWCKGLVKRLETGKMPYTSFQFRLLNEVPTLFLVAIVLLAVYKNAFNVWYALAGMAGFGFLLFAGAKLYKRARMKQNPQA